METPTEYLYRRYNVTLDFITPVAGGTPLDSGLIAGHIARFSEGVSNALKLSKKAEGEVSEEAMNKYMLSCSSGFMLDDQGIYIRGHQLNAMLKDAAQRMKATLKYKGLGNTIRDGGLLFPDRIHLGVSPTIVEKPVHPDGKSSNIKIFQVAEGVKLTLPYAVLENGDLPDQLLNQMWVVAQGVGLGANRHLGYGRFEVANIQQIADWNIADLFRPSTGNGANGHNGMSPVPQTVDAVSGTPAGGAD